MQEGNTSPIGKFFRNKWVRMIGAVDAIFLVIIIAVAVSAPVNQSIHSATISFNIIPMMANISVNGSGDYKSNGEAYSLAPGHYDVTISYPNLATKTLSIDLEENSNTTITTFLTDENFYYYKLRDNYGAFLALAGIASANNNQTTDHDTSAEAFITKFQKDYEKYTNDLPISYSEHDEKGRLTKYIVIRADYDCSVTLCLKATLDEDDKHKVEDMLKEKGFNVEDYEITYKFYYE